MKHEQSFFGQLNSVFLRFISGLFSVIFCLLMISACGQKTENEIDNNMSVSDGKEAIETEEEDTLNKELSTKYYEIEVLLEGGTGKASIQSPTILQIEDDKMTATIVWSSKNYDYMIVDGEKLLPVNEDLGIEDHSIFVIPVEKLDEPLTVIADTVAMSTPHEIEYQLTFYSDTMKVSEQKTILSEEREEKVNEALDVSNKEDVPDTKTIGDVQFELTNELEYATQFQIYKSDKGYFLFHINDEGDYLWVPGDLETPENVSKDVVILKQPKNIYIASTSVMDPFDTMGLLGLVRFAGLDAKDWSMESIKKAMENKEILYAGKYSAPDMELLLSFECDLAIENTMIYHKPEIKEQLEKLGIPVLVERSSYESNPLGRMEWIKLYGYLTGNEDQAIKVFDAEVAEVKNIIHLSNTGKKVVFFYVTSNGAVSVRKKEDYVSKMIELAGGNYALDNLDMIDDGQTMSTVNLQMEAFYEAAKDADVLIYNSTIDGEIYSLDELYKKSPLFKDFKACKEGNVYCSGKNMFQESMSIGKMIQDIHKTLTMDACEDSDFYFLHKVKK